MAGNYDPNKDYAAAIKVETDPVKKQQLVTERQNKIDAMNAAGTNTKGYTNDVYKTTGAGTTGGNSSGSIGGGISSGTPSSFDPNKDYAAAIKNATTEAERQQLMAERQNKLNWMNQTGQNTQGYTNAVYQTQAQVKPMGQYQAMDAGIANSDPTQGRFQIENNINKSIQNMGQAANDVPAYNFILPEMNQVNQNATGTALTPVQQAALQAYYSRQQGTASAEEQRGVYTGDEALSLPDQALMRQYQAAYNDAKARGDQTGMDAAHKMAEQLRDNYRYYPLANSNGYGLGQNDIGFIRDMVVRVDGNGNKYVDEYNRGTVTTTKYDKDGNFVNRLAGTDIAGHDDYVSRQWDRAAEGGRDYMAIRVADPADAKLNTAELLAKYGTQNGMGRDLYSEGGRVSKKIANGQTAAMANFGYFNPDFDYAAALQTETDPTRRATLMEERQNKINYLNSGQAVAQGSVPAVMQGNGQALMQGAGQGTAQGTGYYNPNFDYAAAIQKETDPMRRAQLMQERQNKIDAMNASGTNAKGYSNSVYGAAAILPNYNNLPAYQGMSRQDILDTYGNVAQSLADQRNAMLQMQLNQNQVAQDNANSDYDDLARQAYIAKRQSEMALPQRLAALGISGGGSESADLRLQANYQNNLNSNEQERRRALQELALQAMNAQQQANSDISGFYADAQNNALNAWQNEASNQNSWNQWMTGYQNTLNQQAYERQLAQMQYENELKQQQMQMALQTGDYSKLAALGYNTDYLKKLQQGELEQMALEAALTRGQIAKLNGSVTSGSGGGSGRRSSSGYKNKGDSTPQSLSVTNRDNGAAYYVPGLRWVGYESLDKMVSEGKVREIVDGDKVTYKKVN